MHRFSIFRATVGISTCSSRPRDRHSFLSHATPLDVMVQANKEIIFWPKLRKKWSWILIMEIDTERRRASMTISFHPCCYMLASFYRPPWISSLLPFSPTESITPALDSGEYYPKVAFKHGGKIKQTWKRKGHKPGKIFVCKRRVSLS